MARILGRPRADEPEVVSVSCTALLDMLSMCRTRTEPFTWSMTVVSGCPIRLTCTSYQGSDLEIDFVSAGAAFCPGQARNYQYYNTGLCQEVAQETLSATLHSN